MISPGAGDQENSQIALDGLMEWVDFLERAYGDWLADPNSQQFIAMLIHVAIKEYGYAQAADETACLRTSEQ